MFAEPVDLPGTSIRAPDKPGSKKCPKCDRRYTRLVPKKVGRKVRKHCPYCGKRVK